MRPILFPLYSQNQRLPSAPAVIKPGWLLAVGTSNSVMTPPGVMRPILFPKFSVNQRLPSGPAVMMRGLVSRVEGERVWYSPVTAPLVVMRPILSDNDSQNQRL